MKDFSIDMKGFAAATTATVATISDAAKALFAEQFGTGAVSIEISKSKLPEFVSFCESRGLRASH